MSPLTVKINESAARIARIFGVPAESMQNQIRDEIRSLRAKRRKAVRRKAPVLGLTDKQYDQLLNT